MEAAELACSVSSQQEGVRMVRCVVSQLKTLCPQVHNWIGSRCISRVNLQVINSGAILASRPKSKVAQENMQVFRQAWQEQVGAPHHPCMAFALAMLLASCSKFLILLLLMLLMPDGPAD